MFTGSFLIFAWIFLAPAVAAVLLSVSSVSASALSQRDQQRVSASPSVTGPY